MTMPLIMSSRLATVVGIASFAAFVLGRWYFGEPMGVLTVVEALVAAFLMTLIVHGVVRILDRD